MPQGERSSLLERLTNHLEAENIRVIVVDSVDREFISIRLFCELLVAASASTTGVRDAAEHLATIFTSPQAGERGLVVIIQNADALSSEAIAFAERLATASEARPLPVQLLLLGSSALEFQLPGSFAVRKLPSCLPAPDRSTDSAARRSWTGHGLAAVGGVAVLFFFLAAASGDRERQPAPQEAPTASVVLPVRAALPIAPSDHNPAPAAISQPEPARTVQPATPPEPETSSVTEHPADPPPRSDKAEAVEAQTQPAQADASSPAVATPSPAAMPQDAVGQGPAPTPPPAVATEEAPANQPIPQSAPEAPPAAASPATVQREAQPPSDADAASVAPPAEPPAPAPPPAVTTEQVPAPQPLPQPAPEAPPAATTEAASPPSTVQPEATAPSAADGANAALPATTPTATEQVPASEPPAPSVPPAASPVATTDAAPPPATAQPDSVAPRSVDAAPSTAPQAPSVQPQPPAKPSPAANALLARGDQLIAIGDVATARIVYERAAALKSGRGATSTGRTYDPRFLQQIGAVGVVPDPEAAASWYRKGAAMGDETAASLLGDLGSSKASQ
ncbi:MAG: hypothetical protein J0H14_27235 [Alphaproteobacteria bacterium]|nr:hypothetical protein [Alphaproteobacteria bacterium]